VAAVVAFAAYLLIGSMIDAQERRNERLRAQIRVLDKQIEQINDLEAQKERFISRMQIIELLQRSRPEVVHLFDELVKVMPDGTYLTSVKETGNQLKLEGIAQSSTRVSTLMRNIAASQWLRNPALEVVETAKDNTAGSHFVLDAEQVSVVSADDRATTTPMRKRPVRAVSGSAP
jgi:type IV pilus assembly protein PilN